MPSIPDGVDTYDLLGGMKPSEVVPKPWGYEYCAFDNGKAAVWILHIARGRSTSLHCHPKKRTRLIGLQGTVTFTMDGAQCQMGPLDRTDIPQGTFHQTQVTCIGPVPASQNGAFIMEIEEPSDKGDIVRADDAYGRANQPIESSTVPCGTELLRISHREQSLMGYRFKLESTLGGPTPDLALEMGGEVLGIYKEPTKRLSDCVAEYVRSLGVEHVFGVTGGGSMHLNDSFRDLFVPMLHEQAAAMAADAYGRMKGIGCALVTTGPGGTNAITGVSCAWVDSTPVLFISGQVTTNTLMQGHGVRQFGIQETDIVALVSSQTKYAVCVRNALEVRYELEKAVHIARDGRPGPVWVDIPLDLQSRQVNWEEMRRFTPPKRPDSVAWSLEAERADRPVLVIGNGVHIARAEDMCRAYARILNIPVVSSWLAADIIPSDDPLYIGRFGIFGDRAANFAVQNADFLLVLGCRLSIPQIGHNWKHFARGARIVMVDVDRDEMTKPSLKVDWPIVQDVKDFMDFSLNPQFFCAPWRERCQQWKAKYPVVAAENRETAGNSFKFIDALCDELPNDAVVVTDMGTAFTCTFQAARMKLGQRWFTASGHAPMGYGLPGAVGAHYATGKRITCIVGDGSIMFNLATLKTIGDLKLPIDIIVLDNGGYLTMKHTQMNHFGRFVGAQFENPSWSELFRVFKLSPPRVVYMDPMQPLIPRSSSFKRPDGSISSKPIEDLYPFLPRDEFRAQMIVPPVEAM